MIVPPTELGADQLRLIWLLAARVLRSYGILGTEPGVATVDCEKLPTPLSFSAATWKRYDVPFISPAMMVLVPDVVIVFQLAPPSLEYRIR